MKLLFVTPFAPDRDAMDGGRRVMGQLIEALSIRHQVGLVYFRGRGDPAIGALAGACDVVEELRRPASWARTIRVGGALVARQPLWAARWWVARHARRLRSLVEEWQPDVVQFEYHVTGQYAAILDECPAGRVLVDHEPGVSASASHGGSVARRIIAAADGRSWPGYQRRIYGLVDRVVVFTERDRTAVRALAGDTPVACIPFGTRVPEHPLSPAGDGTSGLLFVGSFRHHPNVDAAMRLAFDIFPVVRAQYPAATLTIVGSDPPAALRAASSDSIAIHESVPDVAPFLDRAAMVIAPLRLGGGMRVKVLETLAAGKALVCSRRAVDGLSVRHGEQVRLAESDADFARMAVELLADPAERTALAVRARAWACAHGRWPRAVRQYDALYDGLARHKGRHQPGRTAGMRA